MIKDSTKIPQEEVKKDKETTMEKLITSTKARQIPKVDELVEGRVISVGKNEVLIDIEGLTCGVVRGHELQDESGEYSNLKKGDEIQATVLDLENEKGMMELSFKIAGHQKAWKRLEELQKSKEVVAVKVLEANKGGLIVKLDQVFGFLPVSQLSQEHYPRIEGGNKQRILEHLKKFIGSSLQVKVISVDKEEEKLIVSEKAAVALKKEEKLKKYKKGEVIEGRVTNVTDFGVFVEFGERIEGLVHISEIAWQRISDLRDLFKKGEIIKAQIISIEGDKVSLSIKRLQKDPWEKVALKYEVGEVVPGKVMKLENYNAFVEIEPGIEGIVPFTELEDQGVKEPKKTLEKEKSYQFIIKNFEPERHRLRLSMKDIREIEELKREKTKEQK